VYHKLAKMSRVATFDTLGTVTKEEKMGSVPNYDEFISISEAAELYKAPRSVFYDAINEGKLRGFDVPGRRGTQMLRAEVAQFMQPKEKQPKKDVG